MKVLFLGSSHFSKVVLQSMLQQKVEVVAVITAPDKEVGRGHKLQANEVKIFACQNGIEVFCSSSVKNDIEKIKQIAFDVSVVASFGQILPKEFLDYRLCLNVHPSALPKYRGASPIQNAILNGDRQTAVTIMKVGQKVDSGDIALQQKVEILPHEMYNALEEKLAQIGGVMIGQALNLLEKDRLQFTPQNEKEATYVKKFNKEDGLLDFSQTSEKIFNQVRALSENLGTYFYLKEHKIKVFEVKPTDEKITINQIANDKNHFLIGCKNGAIEILSCLSPSGKKLSGKDFLNGFKPQGEFVNEFCRS